jgi:hypothetical protein
MVQNILSSSFLTKHIKTEIYKTIILSLLLYGYETWWLTLREECMLRVFENRMFRRIFGPKRDEVTGECRNLQNEELSDLYCSGNTIWVIKSKRMRRVEHVPCMGKGRDASRISVGKPERKTQA